MKRILAAVILGLGLGLGGCAGDAISGHSHNTFLDVDDLVRMTDQMAMSITSNAQVAAQPAPLVIVIEPIVNSTNQIIPGHERELYVNRLEGLLASKPELRQRFVFVMNKRDYQTLLETEGKKPQELGPDPDRLAPDYALTGEFDALTNAGAEQRSDYYHCRYVLARITGPEAGTQIWTGSYEVKKVEHSGFLD